MRDKTAPAAANGTGLRRSRNTGGTCVVNYVIDPGELEAFERFARRRMELVDQHGGTHHCYFLPAEGASDAAQDGMT